MPATTLEQLHMLFVDDVNLHDLDALLDLDEPDALGADLDGNTFRRHHRSGAGSSQGFPAVAQPSTPPRVKPSPPTTSVCYPGGRIVERAGPPRRRARRPRSV